MAAMALRAIPLLVVGAAAGIDLRSRRVPNLLTIPFMLAGLALHPPDAGALLLAAAAFLLWRIGAWGGGDAKLWMGLAFWTPPGRGTAMALAFGASVLAAGALALAFRLLRNRIRRRPALEGVLGVRSPGAWQALPYALWLALGAP